MQSTRHADLTGVMTGQRTRPRRCPSYICGCRNMLTIELMLRPIDMGRCRCRAWLLVVNCHHNIARRHCFTWAIVVLILSRTTSLLRVRARTMVCLVAFARTHYYYLLSLPSHCWSIWLSQIWFKRVSLKNRGCSRGSLGRMGVQVPPAAKLDICPSKTFLFDASGPVQVPSKRQDKTN